VIIKGYVPVRFNISKSEFKHGKTIKSISEYFRKLLVNGLAKFGHKIKKLESFDSEHVFSFSKKICNGLIIQTDSEDFMGRTMHSCLVLRTMLRLHLVMLKVPLFTAPTHSQ
jgi:hypothetical protein